MPSILSRKLVSRAMMLLKEAVVIQHVAKAHHEHDRHPYHRIEAEVRQGSVLLNLWRTAQEIRSQSERVLGNPAESRAKTDDLAEFI